MLAHICDFVEIQPSRRYSTCTWALYDAAINGSNHWVLLAFIANALHWVKCINPHLASMMYACVRVCVHACVCACVCVFVCS